MRQKKYSFTMRTLMGHFAKVLFTMAPGQKPFRAADIMNEARDAFLSISEEECGTRKPTIILDSNNTRDIRKYMKELFMKQPGFILLNFSRVKMRIKFTDEQLDSLPLKDIYDVMITVPNEGFTTITRYDGEPYTQEAFDHDFIDLDAFLGNFAYELHMSTLQDDCFLCDHKKNDPEKCKTCYLNEDLEINYFHLDTPCKNKVVCEVGCPHGMKICCAYCDKQDCRHVCDDTPTVCDQWVYDVSGTMNPKYKEEN